MGFRGSPTAELILEDCEVPESAVLGQVGKAKDETEGDNANQGLWALAENVFTVAVLVGVIAFIRNLMPQSPMIRSVPNEMYLGNFSYPHKNTRSQFLWFRLLLD